MSDPRDPSDAGHDPSDAAMAASWRDAARLPAIASELEAVYAHLSEEIAARGPACWASGRCCNFERTGHRLYTTGLEAAYTLIRLEPARRIGLPEINAALTVGGCPFQDRNLCGVHPIRPLGCRVYFCDRSAQDWQKDLSEQALTMVRSIHDRHGVPYRYAEWRALLSLIVSN